MRDVTTMERGELEAEVLSLRDKTTTVDDLISVIVDNIRALLKLYDDNALS